MGDSSIVRPDLVGNPIPANRSSNNYFNINAFAPTPVGAARVGNAGVGILDGPGTIAVNAGLSKTTTLHERLKLRFEARFTNVLNHTNFAPPATNVSSPSTFGVLQSAQTAENGGNRTGQLALRLDFEGKRGNLEVLAAIASVSQPAGHFNSLAYGLQNSSAPRLYLALTTRADRLSRILPSSARMLCPLRNPWLRYWRSRF